MSEGVVWGIIIGICVIILIAEAQVFAPEKMPWNRRKERKRNAGKR